MQHLIWMFLESWRLGYSTFSYKRTLRDQRFQQGSTAASTPLEVEGPLYLRKLSSSIAWVALGAVRETGPSSRSARPTLAISWVTDLVARWPLHPMRLYKHSLLSAYTHTMLMSSNSHALVWYDSHVCIFCLDPFLKCPAGWAAPSTSSFRWEASQAYLFPAELQVPISARLSPHSFLCFKNNLHPNQLLMLKALEVSLTSSFFFFLATLG